MKTENNINMFSSTFLFFQNLSSFGDLDFFSNVNKKLTTQSFAKSK